MVVLPGYEILEEIHQGIHSIVYRGQKVRPAQPVIIKTLRGNYPPPPEIEGLEHEYEISRNLNLEGVVRPIGLEKCGNGLALILEDFGGESLSNILTSRKLDLTMVLDLGIKISDTLAELHNLKIIHKDINPRNIIYNPKTGQVKLTDFGIATRFAQERPSGAAPHQMEGTPAYISPEQTGRMNRIIDRRTDLYSLGATLYEMLAGHPVFDATDTLELVHRHIAVLPVPLIEKAPEIPEPVFRVVMKLLSKDAQERYQSARGLRADLEACRQFLTEGRSSQGFVPGQHDFVDHFNIPPKLYGRENELTTLMEAFERITRGTTEFLLISGLSGVGKSALVNEIRTPVVEKRGYFVTGKFDQLNRNIPYASLIQATQDLIHQLLTESSQRLEHWKTSLLHALGANGQIIAEVIPEIEAIIGRQQPVLELGPVESQNRFNLVFRNFISVFAQKQHPLVIFLDDLQWSDPASLDLIQQLMTGSDPGCLLLLGAYRDDETPPDHPLMLALQAIQHADIRTHNIALNPLDLTQVTHLVADTLQCPAENALDLAELIHQKTLGNPFFTRQFLETLHRQGLFTFDSTSGTWEWLLSEIQKKNITDNVVNLMVAKLQSIPQDTREVLQVAACLGNPFSLNLLDLVHDLPKAKIASHLQAAVNERLLLPLDRAYTRPESHRARPDDPLLQPSDETPDIIYNFSHDYIRQAAYFLIPEEKQKELHLKAGRALLGLRVDDHVFDIVNHLNKGTDRISDDADKYELSRLNLTAGQKAKASTAYESASNYFRTGTDLLPEQSWQQQYDLTFTLYLERSECEYFTGNTANSETTFRIILENAKTDIDKVEAYRIRVALYTAMGNLSEALNLGIEGLKLTGVVIPLKTSKLSILFEFLETRWMLRGKSIPDLLHLPNMADPLPKAALELMLSMLNPLYHLSEELFLLTNLKMMRLTLKHGNTPVTSTCYQAYGTVLGQVFGSFKTGHAFGKLALRITEKFNNGFHTGRACYQMACALNHWREHANTDIDYLYQGKQFSLDNGDFLFAAYADVSLTITRTALGTHLNEVDEAAGKSALFARRIHFEDMVQFHVITQRMVRALQGETDSPASFGDDEFDENEYVQNLEKSGSGCKAWYAIAKMMVLYLFGNYTAALEMAHRAEKELHATLAQISNPEFFLYSSLTLTALYPQASRKDRRQYRKTLKRNLKKMKAWAANCPENFEHKYLLIKAELARIQQNNQKALDLYDRAIESARKHDYVQHGAIASELAARCYLALGKNQIARTYLQEARYGYFRWGAAGKIQDLEERYPMLFTESFPDPEQTRNATITRTTSQTVDLETVLKTARILSGEIVLDRLLDKLMRIMIENAGAQAGALLLINQGNLSVAATGSATHDDIEVFLPDPDPPDRNLPDTVLQFVQTTQKNVVLNDATQEGRFTTDPYILRHRPKSILCAPMINQGKLTGILYLENNLTAGAFTPDRLELLHLLSSQAAISIENAALYTVQVDLTNAATRFMPREFLQFLGKKSITDVKLGDQVQQEMAVLVSDIRSFAALSETMSPQENFDFINEYFGRVSPLIRQHSGFIVKYMGDGIMAIFPDRIDHALRAAIAQIQEVTQLGSELERKGKSAFKIGIGIHTGETMLGTVGEAERMQTDLLSDTVNLASRLEGLTKIYGASIVISGQTRNRLQDPSQYQMRSLGKVQVVGRRATEDVYEVFEGDPAELLEAKSKTRSEFERGLDTYMKHSFAEASVLFTSVLKTNPVDQAAQLYLKRSAHYMIQGVPDGWNGSEEMTEK